MLTTLQPLRLLVHMIANSSSQPLRVYTRNSMDGQMFVQVLCKKMHNTNVVFGIGVFEDEICFKQINVLFLY
jgi:hypothetical protein